MTIKFHWSDDATEALINLWKDYPLLIQPTHPDYHKKDKKENVLAEIKQKLADIDIIVETSDISSKMLSLKSYFCQQHGMEKALK